MKTNIALVGLDKDLLDLVNGLPGFEVVGFFDANNNVQIQGLPYLGNDQNWTLERKKKPELKVVFGLDDPQKKKQSFSHYGQAALISIISPHSYQSQRVHIGAGTLLQRGVTVMADVELGLACKCNLLVTLHHDCKVGDFCTLAPGAHLLGGVILEDQVFVGARATILPKVKIGSKAVIGAGAVVTKDVSPGVTVAGVPAKEIR